MKPAQHSGFEQSLSTDEPWLFLSPHLDDAVLSCGALIASQVHKRPVSVLTIFTECSPGPHTRAAKSFLRQCAEADAQSLFIARKCEDAQVLAGLGVEFRHLGATDALFRRRNASAGASAIGKVLPELVHRYPTYRFDIALGRVSRGDHELIENLQEVIAKEVTDQSAGLVFCPVGVGRHVDHLITRTIGERSAAGTVFYSDFPYNQNQQPDQAFVNSRELKPWQWKDGIEDKHERVRQYVTQLDALFPHRRIPFAPETYYSREVGTH